MVISVSSRENGISRLEETIVVSIQQSSKITMNRFRVKINLLLYFVVNFMNKMVILVFFMVISVNRRLFRYFGSYSGISVIPVILVNRRTAPQGQPHHTATATQKQVRSKPRPW